MAVINVYEQYFEADAEVNGVKRRAALVALISDSEAGHIRYEAAATFFPHRDEEDFAVSYDAYVSAVLYEDAGRRSRKREAALRAALPETVDRLADGIGGRILWDRPLREARFG